MFLYHNESDIYRSKDGIKWTRVGNSTTSESRWTRRSAFGVATMNENVYVIGGYIGKPLPTFYNDIWISSDGACETWNKVVPISKSLFDPVADFRLLSFDGMLWLIVSTNINVYD